MEHGCQEPPVLLGDLRHGGEDDGGDPRDHQRVMDEAKRVGSRPALAWVERAVDRPHDCRVLSPRPDHARALRAEAPVSRYGLGDASINRHA